MRRGWGEIYGGRFRIMAEKIRVTLVRSGIGRNKKIRETLRGLGLTKLNKTVTLQNTPAIRGMIEKVSFMVRIEVPSRGETP